MSTDMDEYRFFKEATLKICGSLHVQEAIDAFRIYAQTCIPFDEACVAFYDEFTSSGIILAISSSDPIPLTSEQPDTHGMSGTDSAKPF